MKMPFRVEVREGETAQQAYRRMQKEFRRYILKRRIKGKREYYEKPSATRRRLEYLRKWTARNGVSVSQLRRDGCV
jgi:ribosomal protein S21